MVKRYNNLGEQVIKKEKYNNLGQPIRNSNNAADDEFGFDHDISEEKYNKLRAKEQKKSMPQPQKKRKKRRIPKEKPNHFRGLGSSKGRGPWPR